MRQRFEQKIKLGTTPIAEVKFNFKTRDELPPILQALQYIFVTPELSENIFEIMEKRVFPKAKNKVGRKGMDLWQILVLGVIRHALGTNWDKVHYYANSDKLTRGIMGIYSNSFLEEEIEVGYQTIIDNVSLLDEQTLEEINQVVVETGHSILKKKEAEEALRLKTDSYTVETNVHFPTDLGLLYDATRKLLDIMKLYIDENPEQKGWRKIKDLRAKLKACCRATMFQVFKGKIEENKKAAVKGYLNRANYLVEKVKDVLEDTTVTITPKVVAIMETLRVYLDYAVKFIDQIDRRLLKGEVIAAEEKIYSIFEPHTEWITKGKLNKKVELGHLMLVSTDQHQFIVDYKVMLGERDAVQVAGLIERIENRFKDRTLASISFDKGFYSKDNLQKLQESKIGQIILPKKGKKNKQEKAIEAAPGFVKLRHQHSAVESNINMLEHHGLNRCVDKGIHGFKRYVGLSVLSYNLHILGNLLVKKRQEAERKRQKAALRNAA